MNATLKMAVIFILSTAFLGATLWLALPTLDECVYALQCIYYCSRSSLRVAMIDRT